MNYERCYLVNCNVAVVCAGCYYHLFWFDLIKVSDYFDKENRKYEFIIQKNYFEKTL